MAEIFLKKYEWDLNKHGIKLIRQGSCSNLKVYHHFWYCDSKVWHLASVTGPENSTQS